MKNLFLLLTIVLLATACSNETANEPTAPVSLHLEQRHTAELDSLETGLSVRIDDITDGKTFLTVYVNGETVKSEYIATRMTVKAPVNGKTLYITCTKLDNQLVGRDFADLSLSWNNPMKERHDTAPNEVPQLLAKIRDSQLHFVRNGETYTGPEAARFLEMKWDNDDKIRTKEAFIREIATKSSTTGQYYLVVHPDGTKTRLAEWLRQQ